MSWYYRSLLIYYFTPLVAAGVMSKAECDRHEALILRKQNLLPNDIKSTVIKNVCDHFATPVGDVITRLARRNRLYVEPFDKAKTKGVEDALDFSEEDLAKRISRRKDNIDKLKISRETEMLMLAVTAGRTAVHWNRRHWCMEHRCWVLKSHLANCGKL